MYQCIQCNKFSDDKKYLGHSLEFKEISKQLNLEHVLILCDMCCISKGIYTLGVILLKEYDFISGLFMENSQKIDDYQNLK